MKKCPECNRTYSDDTLSFCLEDGALLSASYNAREAVAPTVAFNAPEVPTVVAGEIPTVVNPPRPTEQASDAGVGWKTYLAGFFISLVAGLIYTYLLYPFYADATVDVFDSIADNFNDRTTGYIVAGLVLITPLNMFVSALIAFSLGFIWWRGKWKWGLVSEIPTLIFTTYYVATSLIDGHDTPFYYIRVLFTHTLYILTAMLSAQIGSRLSRRRRNR